MPATDGIFRNEWKELCVEAASSGSNDHAIHLCQGLIEVAFRKNLHRPNEQPTSGLLGVGREKEQDIDHHHWVKELTSIHDKTSSPVMEGAWANIMQYNYEDGPIPMRVLDKIDEIEEQYYFPNLSSQDYRALNTYTQFTDLINKKEETLVPSIEAPLLA